MVDHEGRAGVKQDVTEMKMRFTHFTLCTNY